MSNAEGTHPEDEDFAKKYDRRKVEVADALISLEAPVADDRVAVPPSKRLAATMETLEYLLERHEGDPLLEVMISQARAVVNSLTEMLRAYNRGLGTNCLDALERLGRLVLDGEAREVGQLPTLELALQAEIFEGKLLDMSEPRVRAVNTLLQARTYYLHMPWSFYLIEVSLHDSMDDASKALHSILSAIEDPPPRILIESTSERASHNIEAFVGDLGCDGVTVCPTGSCHGGRFEFVLRRDSYECRVEMPGMDLNEIRPDSNEYDGWDYFRLVVDGSSWLWEYAITSAKDVLLGISAEEDEVY